MLHWPAAPCTAKAQANTKCWVSLVHASSRDPAHRATPSEYVACPPEYRDVPNLINRQPWKKSHC